MLEDEKIDEIDEKLDKTEDYEIIINLLYQKVDLLEQIIGKNKKQIEKLKNQNKLASEEHEKRFNEFEVEIEKKDKTIKEMAYEIANTRDKGFMASEIDEIINEFERKVEE